MSAMAYHLLFCGALFSEAPNRTVEIGGRLATKSAALKSRNPRAQSVSDLGCFRHILWASDPQEDAFRTS